MTPLALGSGEAIAEHFHLLVIGVNSAREVVQEWLLSG